MKSRQSATGLSGITNLPTLRPLSHARAYFDYDFDLIFHFLLELLLTIRAVASWAVFSTNAIGVHL